MPTWWGKSSSKEHKKKGNKESIIDLINRKLNISSEEKSNSRGSRGHSDDTISEMGSRSRVPSRSLSPSMLVSRCQSFAERPCAQPLPLPDGRLCSLGRSKSNVSEPAKPMFEGGSKPLYMLPLPNPGYGPKSLHPANAEGDPAIASVTSDTSSDSDDPTDSHLPSPLTSDYENGNKTAANSPPSMKQKEQTSFFLQQNPKETFWAPNLSLSKQLPFTSPKLTSISNPVQYLPIPHQNALCGASDSLMSSPSRSPLRTFGTEQVVRCDLLAGRTYSDVCLLGSGHCSSPGSGFNSGHNSIAGDMSGQLLWPNSRCSPECSPIPSPRLTSPGPSSRIHSGAVTPQHPRAGSPMTESSTSRLDEGKLQSHRLPLPPITVSNACPFSSAYSTVTSPSMPRSPNRAENPPSPGSRWKKGRLIGRGTFGDVFVGFNSESGEMCAMKEVTLFSDDPKSKESAQQLGQEIMLLSRLRHPNIVRYYGSETQVDDKLHIYLEYVSGGSIHKLLQDYGPLGETAIRSYTQQILAGLAYLHAQNTVHRDIKGANILVAPSGRVKVADFGMAKHITGQSSPLSLKGSPYWMAPEVIKNSNGCNLAVDIWSLGCTVLEMAMAKPPWSQYEGVAAMFKIGNSKELPAIPDHLSDEGKDFVRTCLQRNPSLRPTAAQLLEHPFLRNIAPFERPIWSVDNSEATPAATNTGSSMGIGQGRNVSGLDTEGIAILQSRYMTTSSGSSDVHTLNTRSCPVSPIGSPLLRSRSPLQMNGRISPPLIYSPPTASGSSTPLAVGTGTVPFHHSNQPMACMQESTGMTPWSQNCFFTHNSNSNHEMRPDPFQRVPQTPLVRRDIISSDTVAMGNHFGQTINSDVRELYCGPLLNDHAKLTNSWPK